MKRGELRLHVREAAVKRVERQHGRARSSRDRTVLLRQSLRLLPERRSRAGSARWEGNAHRDNGASYKGEETPTPNKGVPPHGPRKLADPPLYALRALAMRTFTALEAGCGCPTGLLGCRTCDEPAPPGAPIEPSDRNDSPLEKTYGAGSHASLLCGRSGSGACHRGPVDCLEAGRSAERHEPGAAARFEPGTCGRGLQLRNGEAEPRSCRFEGESRTTSSRQAKSQTSAGHSFGPARIALYLGRTERLARGLARGVQPRRPRQPFQYREPDLGAGQPRPHAGRPPRKRGKGAGGSS